MAPLRPVPTTITCLTDKELADRLEQNGVDPGPILPSTRKVYERKLFEIETGLKAAPSSGYTPVDDDDEEDEEEEEMDEDSADEEVTFQQKQPRQRTTQTTRTGTRKPSPRRPLHSGIKADGSRSQSQTCAQLGLKPMPLAMSNVAPCNLARAEAREVTSDVDLQSVLQLIQTFDKGRLEIVRSAVQRRLDNM